MILPGFWSNRPATWFLHIENTCDQYGLNGDQRYACVVPALPEDTIAKLWPILQNPPETRKYEHLKAALINRFTPSQYTRDCQILALSDGGVSQPSDLLAQLQSLDAEPSSIYSESVAWDQS